MAEALEITPWRHSPPARLPDETLEAYIICRAARMRKVQALLAVCREETAALGDGPECGELVAAHDRLMDEEEHLWLHPGEEAIQYDHGARMSISLAIIGVQNALGDARTSGQFDEVRRLEAKERRLWARYEKIYHPDGEAVEAQRDFGDRSEVCHYAIRQDLLDVQNAIATARDAGQLDKARRLGSTERRCLALWERACRDAAEARAELLAQGLVSPRAVAAR